MKVEKIFWSSHNVQIDHVSLNIDTTTKSKANDQVVIKINIWKIFKTM